MRVDELVRSINHFMRGNDYIHPKAVSILIEAYRLLAPEIHPPLHLITHREYEVLQLLANGKGNQEIGESLGIHVSTVKKSFEQYIGKAAGQRQDECGDSGD